VILSIETTQKQAEEHGHSFEKELNVLLIHGILHLLGYDHHTDDDASIMERLEQTLLNC
jgi:probable rRNA maturation factor